MDFAPQPGKSLTQVSEERHQPLESLMLLLATVRKSLFEIRATRIRPSTDAKILTSWNGLMIAGLADAGRILNRQDYIEASTKAAEFILRELKTQDGRLHRSYALGESKLQGYLDDYAFLVHGLLRLHLATKDDRWLEQAIEITNTQIRFFRNEESGGFYYTVADHPELIVRFQDPVDGVIPSGNSMTAANLLYLIHNANRTEFEEPLRRLLLSSISSLERNPRSSALMSAQIGNWLDRSSQLSKAEDK